MTVTITQARTSAPRHAATRSPVRVLAAVFMVAWMLVGVVPAHADATPAPTPTPAPTTSEAVTLVLAPMRDAVVGTGDPLGVWITQRNATNRTVPDSTVTLLIGGEPLDGRTAVADWLTDETEPDDTLDPIAEVPLESVAAGQSETVSTSVAPDAAALQNRTPGVYPLLARASGGGVSLSARSVMIVPGAVGATPVGVIVPVTAGPLSEGMLTSDELAELTAADGRLTGIVDAIAGTPAILAVDPAIPAAIRVLGSSAPETATAWLTRMLNLPNERFALQYGDADIAAQLAAGATAPAQPASLASYLTAGALAAATTGTPSPSSSATAAAAPPTTAELLNVVATREDVYWPVTGSADAATVAALGAVAAAGPPALTLVPSASVDAGANAQAVPAHARAGQAELLVYDQPTSAALHDAASTADTRQRGAALAAATANLTLAAQAGRPLLVVVDRANDFDRAGLRAAVTAATSAPGVTAATLAQLIETDPLTVAVTGGAADADTSTAASALAADEQSLDSFSTVLDDPAVLLTPERAEMLQLLGAGWNREPALWATAVAAHRAATASTLDAVDLLPSSTTNLLSSGAPFGFFVRNDLAWPVNVVLNAVPDDLRLEMDPTTAVRAYPGGNTRVEVPVQARLGNGEVTVALNLHSPTGVDIGEARSVDVNVHADWEGVGVVILSVLVGGFIVLGIVRTVLHRRWLRRQPAGAATPDAPQ